MSEVVIRPAEPGEFGRIGEITVAAYRNDGLLVANPEYTEELADAASRAEHGELVVAVDGAGELLGSVTITPPGSRFAEISRPDELEFRMLSTAPAARGRGVGEALTRAVLGRARELGARRVVLCSLDAMKSAHRLYERIGFARMPERDWEPVPGFWLRAFTIDV
ncbi:GNAT family N-acetyltransferase [Amycolatopsis acidicola]|uniref:GNAT family N-acetyltransferase n=1 Tax=Amycolatopsis acidicola TaxID=2596893 RepID=A0A5N0UR43_9PSEU|nr:GNAT family N-acetyltransferase [Amycolatopsis acidicola]KAA9153905.1 GNAT family N-acetyltransferase [Amycolatopsis acidicola]